MSKSADMQAEWDERASEDPYYWQVTNNKNWDKKAFYETGREYFDKYLLPFLKEKQIQDYQTKAVLDIGCGTGRITWVLAEKFGQAIGTDVSPVMIKQANQDLEQKNLIFLVTDGKTLIGIEDSSVDIAFSFAALQHVPNKKDIWQNFIEIYRVLKPGGIAKIQIRGAPGKPPGKVLWFCGLEKRYIAISLWRRVVPLFSSRRYNTIFGACFSSSETKKEVKKIGFQNVKTYLQEGRQLWVEMQKPS